MTSVATRDPSSGKDRMNTGCQPLAMKGGAFREKEKWARS